MVVEKMQGGADLMTPGLQRGPPFPKKATKGAIVAVASLESPTVPVAVGTCEIDINSLQKVQGAKGIAVETFHWAGDEVWSWSSNSNPGIDPPEYLEGWDDEKEDAGLAAETEALNLEDGEEDGGILLNAERSEAEKAQGLEGEKAPSNKDFVDEVDEKELSTKGGISMQIPSRQSLTFYRNRRSIHKRLPLWRTASH
jgi:translation initiation factor 2D